MGNAKKATVDFVVLDNGTVKFTAVPVDVVGNPTNLADGTSTPVWTSADSTTLSVVADTTDTTGLTAIGTPLKLGTSISVSVSAVLPDGVTTVSGDADPVDVVAGPAGSFTVAEQ